MHKRKTPSIPLNLLVSAPSDCEQLKYLKDLPLNVNLQIESDPEKSKELIKSAEAFVFWGSTLYSNSAPSIIQSGLEPGSKLEWIHIPWAGLEKVFYPSLIENPVMVTNAAGVYAEDLAEFAIGAMIYFAKDFRGLIKKQEAKIWEEEKVEEIRGKKVGVIGFGGIGKALGIRAKALGMKVTGVRLNPKSNDLEIEEVGLDKLNQVLAESDYVVLATPLTPETRGMIGKEQIDLLKNNCVLINIGRGATVDEPYLAEALKNKKIRGAALDVFVEEPLPKESPFYSLENVLLSPHCADQTDNWQNNSMKFFVENVKRYMRGEELLNVVDKKAGY